MTGQLRMVDLVVLLVYMSGVFGLGCWFLRKSRHPTAFMAASRSLPGWAVGFSILGTYVSSIGFLGNTGKAYGANWNAWAFGLSLPIAGWIAVKWFIPLYRSSQDISAYAHLEKRFGPWARTYALVCFLLAQLARIGTILYLVALALAPLTGWSITHIILITGMLVTLYTLIGGIEAVIWTDVIQSMVLIAGAFFCAFIIIRSMPGGLTNLMEIANKNEKFSLGSFAFHPASLQWTNPTFWMVLLYGIFINLQNFGIDQGFVQRYVAAKSDRDARFSLWLATFLFPTLSAVFFFIGTGLFSLYEANPKHLEELRSQVAITQLQQNGKEITPTTISETANSLKPADVGDKVLPHFIVTQLPVGLAGLLIAAIFAAAMSSMDTSLNSSATLYLCDIHQRYLNPAATDRQSMRVLYAATVIMGVAGTFAALAMINVRSALDAWWKLQGIFTGGMLGLFLLGLISRRARNAHAMIAATVGILLIMWMSLSQTDGWLKLFDGYVNPLHGFMTVVLGTTSIVLTGVLASRFFPSTSKKILTK